MPAEREAVLVHAEPLGVVPDSMELLRALRAGAIPWMLDSALVSERLGRFSFAGCDPWAIVRARGERVDVECLRAARPGWRRGLSTRRGPATRVLAELLPRLAAGSELHGLPFLGGAVGYWGYELAEQTQPVKLSCDDDLHLPDAAWLLVDRLIAIDHVEQRAWAVGLGFAREPAGAERAAHAAAAAMVERCRGVPAAGAPLCEAPRLDRVLAASRGDARRGAADDIDPAAHATRVRELLAAIRGGELYQANLTQRLSQRFEGGPLELYAALRSTSPAPFAAYLELPELAVLSSSPERFLRLAPDGRVESRPIKGTRPRGSSEAEDRALAEELAGSEKDGAENLMIVDLVRNDLGRVCEIGSVAVPELRVIERYATVFQMVSTVTGRLRPELSLPDLLEATFPPGSMTGAPKIAAMRAIDRLETVRRTVYSGAIGYVDVRGGADLSVVIRTVLLVGSVAHLHVGGGIVADSQPELERREALDKAAALLAALALAASRSDSRAA